jgi:hypothetical protein
MFRLAGRLGMTVSELGQRMGAGELAEWQALLTVEPYGAWQMDLLAGLIAYSSVAVRRQRGSMVAVCAELG